MRDTGDIMQLIHRALAFCFPSFAYAAMLKYLTIKTITICLFNQCVTKIKHVIIRTFMDYGLVMHSIINNVLPECLE